MVRVDKRTDVNVKVLRVGDSFLLSRHIVELEIILFRPLNSIISEPKPISSFPPIQSNRRKRTSVLSNITSFDTSVSRKITPTTETFGSNTHVPNGFAQSTQHDDSSPATPSLFFDSAICLFLDGENKTDYVTVGHHTTDNKGLQYKPHAVVIGNESIPHAYSTYNVYLLDSEQEAEELYRATEVDSLISQDSTQGGAIAVNNGATMAAGDGVIVLFKRIEACAGLLVSATLFSKDVSVCDGPIPYYMVRKPKSSIPLCLVPLRGSFEHSKSLISLMIRKNKIRGETVWELVNLSEPLDDENVKNVISSMAKRRLGDPIDYQRDFDARALEGNVERVVGCIESASQEDDDDENLKETRDEIQSLNSHEFNDLLSNVPYLVREGRKQYNVGRPYVQATLAEDTSSEDDPIIDDALRAVVPQYTNNNVVRYEKGAYNIGSKIQTLMSHYVNHRKEYGLKAAMSSCTRDTSKPQSLLIANSNNIPVASRFGAESDQRRSSFPIELQPTISIHAKEKQKGGWNAQHRGTLHNVKRGTVYDHSSATSVRKKKHKKKNANSRSKSVRTRSRSRNSFKQRGVRTSSNKSVRLQKEKRR